MQFFSHASNARRAARKALGKTAKEGEHYKLIRNDKGGVAFQPIKPRRPAKVTPAKARPPAPGATPGWQERLHAMLVEGCTAADVARAFDWLEHTARARISTALREQGIQVERFRVERAGKKVSMYRALPQLKLGEKRTALGNIYRKDATP